MRHARKHLSAWRLQHKGMPLWRNDQTAIMLGIAGFGCPRCGYGAIKERDESTQRGGAL